jgi:hypothetical protein
MQTLSVSQVHKNADLMNLTARDCDTHSQVQASPALALNIDDRVKALGMRGVPHPRDFLI